MATYDDSMGLMSSSSQTQPRRLLILVVDRDDDLGRKAGVKSPVVGRGDNLEAAVKLALADPEDSDANSIFSAVKLYDELSRRDPSLELEIATVTGVEKEGIEADVKIASELQSILEKFPAEECIFVSDGASDDLVIPVVSSLVRIVSVRRVIVKQSQSVEQTWLLLGRYLKMAFTEPRYAKLFLGIPGVVLMLMGAMLAAGIATLPYFFLLLGVLLMLRGFGIDQRISNSIQNISKITQMASVAQMRFYASLASLAIFLIALYVGIGAAVQKYEEVYGITQGTDALLAYLTITARVSGAFLVVSIDFITVSVLLLVIANMLYYLFIRHPRFWRTIQAGILAIWLWALLKRAGIILEAQTTYSPTDPNIALFLLTGVLGVFTLAVTFTITRTLQRIYGRHFRRVKR